MALGFKNPDQNAPTMAGPTTRNVTANETVSGQMDKILASNSPLLQRAKTRAAQAANSRGLLNSSMGVQAGEEAVLTTAMPIAQQDAATFNNQGVTNQNAANQFGLSNQNYQQQVGKGAYSNGGLLGANLSNQLKLQTAQNTFASGEKALDRTQQTALQEGENTFASGESALGRAQQTALQAGQNTFASGESALGRAQQTAQQTAQNTFATGESALDRTQRTELQDDQQTFASDESALGRTQQTDLQAAQNTFASGESALDRTQRTELQDDQQTFASGESALGRTQQTALQDDQQTFATGESALDRAQQATNIAAQHTNAVATAKTLADHQTANVTLQGKLKTELTKLGQTNSLELSKLEADLSVGKLDAEVYANTRGAYLLSVTELVRQSQITVGELQMKEGISAEDKAKMLTDQATLLTSHLTAQKTLFESSATWEKDWSKLPSVGVDDAGSSDTTDE